MPAEKPEPTQPSPAAESDAPSGASRWAVALNRFLTPKWIAILIAVSLVIHGAGLAVSRMGRAPADPSPHPEIGLGQFEYHTGQSEQQHGGLSAAGFSVYVTMLDQLDRGARERLDARKFRVQQDIEQLLRQAHSGDFEDPSLTELKRQIQEQINEALGVRAVADVIITDLRLRYGTESGPPSAETARGTPWAGQPSG